MNKDRIRHLVRVIEVREDGTEWPLSTTEIAESGKARLVAKDAGKSFGPLYEAMKKTCAAMVAQNMEDALRVARAKAAGDMPKQPPEAVGAAGA